MESRHRITPLCGIAILLFAMGTAQAADASRERTKPISLVVIHATGGVRCEGGELLHLKGGTLSGIKKLFEDDPDKSIHFIVGRDGAIESMVAEDRVAYHAKGVNGRSIGIELINDGDGKDSFPEDQITALITLLERLLEDHSLTADQIKGHSEVDERAFECGGKEYKLKIDPGGEYPGSTGNFPWERVRSAL